MMDEKILKLKEYINKYSNIVVFAGAGMSTASGIPDFRSANGIYHEKSIIPPEQIISHSFFMKHPKEFYDFYFDKMVYPNAKPNLAHLYFSELAKKKDVKIITQNIDGLDKVAGSQKVYELHGTIRDNYCMKCGKHYTLEELKKPVPYCECGGLIKPNVVLYEESLDQTLLQLSLRIVEACELIIVIGTSLVVEPAASLVRIGLSLSKKVVIINKDKTHYDNYADVVINDDIIKVVKELKENC